MAKTNHLGNRSGRLAPVTIPEELVKGNKFIKFDNDSGGIPVTLWVDPKGYFVYWKDQNKEMDCLDMSYIRDTRTGKYAHLPKDSHLRETINMGDKNVPLEDKIITICHGTDTVNINFVNFSAISKEIAKQWTDMIFKCATNLLAPNVSITQFLDKCYTRLTLIRDNEGKIPVRNLIRMFAQNKEDRKRIQQALETAQLPSGTNEKLNSLTFEQLFTFYRHLCGRQEVDTVFNLLRKSQKPYVTAEQFMHFLNNEQRDSRLNEVLYPLCDLKKAQAIIEQHECNQQMGKSGKSASRGHLSQEGFLRYLMSQENTIFPTEKFDLWCDMTQPLSHYLINSSHNTYLSGHQLTGKSSVEIYRQVLLTGCRCVELDCWDGKGADEEPIITHGFTMCTEVSFKEVIEAISESAFKVSDYPLILSFENHCSARQQAKMAVYCRTIFGDALLADPLDSHLLEPYIPLPSPELLKRKILIKNKKRNFHSRQSLANGGLGTSVSSLQLYVIPEPPTPKSLPAEGSMSGNSKTDQVDVTEAESSSDTESEEHESGMTDEEIRQLQVVTQEKGTSGQEVEAAFELSSLVNYVQPARFHTFESAEKRSRSYECTSFVETQASTLLKSFPVDFVNYNKRQLSRVYPKGTRVDSSNYMPQMFWNAGCQMAALNFQTLDLPMQLNLGMFEYNGRSGYIVKPDFMRRKDRQFDPFTELTVDGIVAGTVKVKIISGQLLTDRRVGTYVEVDMFGLPADTVRRKFRTKVCPNNGINPVYDEEPFVFKKVILPHLATLRIAVYQENGTSLIGHRVLPVESLRPGYRHISLRNEFNQPLGLATLFVHITVKDFVPDTFADFAEALSNPIAYQSSLEKHSQQLAVFEMDYDTESVESSPGNGTNAVPDVTWFTTLPRQSNSTESKYTGHGRTSDSSRSEGGNLATSISATSCTDINRCLSVPDSQLRRGSETRINFELPIFEKDFALAPVNIEQFKKSKPYQKLYQRLQREMAAFQTKNEKLHAALLQQQQMEMLKVTKGFAKPKHGTAYTANVVDPLADDENLKELQRRHKEQSSDLLRQQFKSRLELELTSQMQQSARLHQMAAADRDSRLAQIEKVYNLEIARYKKRQDAQNWDEMKALAKKYKDKDDLARVRREAMQKNIKAIVAERQKLKENQDELVSQVNALYNDVFQKINDERRENEKKLHVLSTDRRTPGDYTGTAPNGTESKENETDSLTMIRTVYVTEYVSTRL